MLELLQRITAINNYAKDCHYNFQAYGQHQLADVNQEELLDYKDLINEVCYLGLGMDAPESEEVLLGALNFIPEVSEDDHINLARLKLLIKMTLVHIEEMKLETRGIENLIGDIAQDLQQLHGLLYKVVDDEEDLKYLENIQNAEDDKKKDDLEWITINGSHIPIKLGQSKDEAVREFLGKNERKANINTTDFKSWFGDSKAVDESGDPLVLYHGTDTDFKAFDTSRQKGGTLLNGFYFTPSYSYAESVKKNAKVIPVYLSMKNPIVINKGELWTSVLLKNVPEIKDIKNRNDILQAVKKKGFDGYIWNKNNGEREYVVFEPNQIKSIYNKGSFSKDDNNINNQSEEETYKDIVPEDM